ncbi:MAG: hypothetical protein IKX75_05600, partial [Desulfovibrio sp.]|nr:hypothetical protein [Desulfovibrio sp.]
VAGGVAPLAGSLAPGVRVASLDRRERRDMPAGVLAEAPEDSLASQVQPAAQEQFAEGLAAGSGPDLRNARKALEAMADAVLASHAGSAFDVCMDAMGRAVVKRALELCQGNRSRAARLLGLSRPTLLARMERYGLKVETRIS